MCMKEKFPSTKLILHKLNSYYGNYLSNHLLSCTLVV